MILTILAIIIMATYMKESFTAKTWYEDNDIDHYNNLN